MVELPGLVTPSIEFAYPEPEQRILNLLYSYGYIYPGNQYQAPDLKLITLTESTINESINAAITRFLTDIHPKLRPSVLTPIAMTASDQVYVNPLSQSNILNFSSVDDNSKTDIVPSGTAKPLNASITNLETIFHRYALTYIMNIFNTHAADVSDNPHQVTGVELVDLWTDFFQALYAEYILLIPNGSTLEEFIIAKTEALPIATLTNYTDPTLADFISSIEVTNALITTHNTATDPSIHPTLQADLSAEITLPRTSYHLVPELYIHQFEIQSPTPTLCPINSLSAVMVIDHAAILAEAAISPTNLLTELATEGYYPYFMPVSLEAGWPPLNGTCFFNVTVDLNDPNMIPLLNIYNSISNDNLIIQAGAGATSSLSGCLYSKGLLHPFSIPAYENNVTFFITWTSQGINFYYVNNLGNLTSISIPIPNLVLDYDTIQLGIPLSYPAEITTKNSIQEFTIWKSVLSTAQMNLILASNPTW